MNWDGLDFLTKGFEWLLRSSWQAVVLIAAVLILQFLLKRQLNARWRFNLWLLVLLRLLVPFSPESALSVFNYIKVRPPAFSAPAVQPAPADAPSAAATEAPTRKVAGPAATPATAETSAEPPAAAGHHQPSSPLAAPSFAPKRKLTGMETIALSWLAGVLALLAHVGRLAARTHRQARKANPIADASVADLFAQCRAQMGVRASVRLLETEMVKSPALCGVFRPCLLLPPGLTRDFSPRELRYIFLHELAHVKRRDVALNWLLTGLQILHWFNPAVWFGFARLRADRELACDALAMGSAREEEAKDYGRTVIKLLETLSRPSPLPGLVGIMEDRHQMERRIRMIAAFKKTRRWSIPALLIMLALTVTGLTDAVKPGTAAKPKQPGETLTLTVLDAATGTPIEGAGVVTGYSPYSRFLKPPLMEKTDAKGIAKIPKEGYLEATKGLGVLAPGFEPKAVTWTWPYPVNEKPRFPEIPKEYTLKLERGGEIGGTVRDEAGKPLANVRVEIIGRARVQKENMADLSPVEYSFYDAALAECPVTDAEGRWTSTHFPKQIDSLEISLVRPDNSCALFHTEPAAGIPTPGGQLIPLGSLQNQKAEFVMKQGTVVRGVVVNASGKPLHGITLNELDNRSHVKPLAALVTGSDGRFELPNRDPHQLLIKASGPGFALQPVYVDVHPGMPEVRIVMNPAKPLRVRVVDEGGKPLPNASMAVARQEIAWQSKADSKGLITWPDAPLEPLVYAVFAEGYSPTAQKLAPSGSEQTIRLTKGTEAVLSLSVKAETQAKEPVPSFTVKVVRLDRTSPSQKPQSDVIGEGKNGVLASTLPISKVAGPEFRLQLEAPGFVPYLTEPIDNFESGISASVTLRKASTRGGVVLQPDGPPAARARLVTSNENGQTYFNFSYRSQGMMEESSQLHGVRTDDSGHFELPPEGIDKPVIIIHSSGILETTLARLQEAAEVRLTPWGRLEGTLTENGRPKAAQRLELLFGGRAHYTLGISYYVNTDQAGHFVFEKVPPGECTLACTQPSKGTWSRSHLHPVSVKPGETVNVDYAATGRSVTGKLKATTPSVELDWKNAVATKLLSTKRARRTSEPPSFADFVRHEDYRAAFETWQKSLAGAPAANSFDLEFNEDGSFHAEAVPPGTYELEVTLTDIKQPRNAPWREIGSIKQEVTVPAAPEGAPGEAADLGVFEIAVADTGLPKAQAKPLPAWTRDGKQVDLTQYRGKCVLVIFWASWASPSPEETAVLNAVAKAHEGDPHFAMIGVSLDDSPEPLRQWPESKDWRWTTAQLKGRDKNSVTEDWNVDRVPTMVLVGPDGRVAVHDLKPARLQPVIEDLLKSLK